MITTLALLCAAVVLGIIAHGYTRRVVVRNLFASLVCVDAKVTAAVRLAALLGMIVCTVGALKGLS